MMNTNMLKLGFMKTDEFNTKKNIKALVRRN